MVTRNPLPHLWRHPNGTFYLAWQEDKKPKKKSLRTKNKAQAKIAMEQAVAEMLVEGRTPGSRNMTLHAAADAWLKDRSRPLRALSRVTIQEYQTFVKQIKAVTHPEFVADEVAPSDIRFILDQLQSTFGIAPTTVKKRHGALRMLFNWMLEEDIVRRTPVKLSDAPYAQAEQKPPWTREQYQGIQEALLGIRDSPSTSDYWQRASQLLVDLTQALWLSGMRSIQAYRMEWGDGIDLEKMVWVVRSPRKNKGGEKLKPIHKRLKPMLVRRQLLGDPGPFPQKTCIYAWRKFKERTPAFRGLSLHQCRSRVSTELNEMGEDEAARKILGHATLQSADLYDWASVERYREILNRVSE